MDHFHEVHITPVNDWGPHEGKDCSCRPTLEYEDPDTGEKYSGMLVIHNSFDGRERYEEREKG